MTVPRTICLGFLVVITVGTLLLMLPVATSGGTWNNPIVALFTATSAVCVTGLSVVDISTYFSFWGQLLILVLFQIGGLGYMTANTFLLLLLGRRFGLRDKIAIQQALDKKGLQGSAQLIQSIIATTLIFEITGTFLLLPVFAPDHGLSQGLWLSVFHSVSAWTNTGFGLFSDSFVRYQSTPLLNIVIAALIILGGIGHQVVLELYLWLRDRVLRRPERFVFSLNFKVATSTTLVLLALGTIAFTLTEIRNPQTLGSVGFGTKLMAAFFLSTVTRTAGFNSVDIGKLGQASLLIAIALMIIGGSPGGTAGGMKTTTLRVLTSCTKTILQGKEQVVMYQRQIPMALVLKAVGVAVGSIAVIMTTTTLIALSDPALDALQILFEAASAFATVGLSTGITGVLSEPAKLILVVTMYVGRVGVLLLMSAILGDPRPSSVNYADENLLVG
ncbi:MAG: ATPase [Leptolyngbyaceae cyanobacterium RU_5_1]|nr:ATPase [Leptolyngbyaceae cyanobacterium RU_5_1]